MKLEREVIIDLLPLYFSGEASPATRILVEEYFRENPDFERAARGTVGALDALRAPTAAPEEEREKAALERSRDALQTRTSFFWIAVCYTVLLLLFKVRDHRPVFIMFEEKPTVGVIFASLAVFFWFGYFRVRKSRGPLPQRTVYLWLAIFYSLMPFLFRIQDHKIVWIAFTGNAIAGSVFIVFAVLFWIAYFVTRFGNIRFPLPFTGGRLSAGAWKIKRK